MLVLLGIVSLLVGVVVSDIHIVAPEELTKQMLGVLNKPNELVHSLSTFGEVDY